MKRAWVICVLLLNKQFFSCTKTNWVFTSSAKTYKFETITFDTLTRRDTIHILAIMVEFQTDADYQTTGDGKLLNRVQL